MRRVLFPVLFGGSSAFTPASLTGLALWLKADAGIYTDDAATTPAVNDGDVIAVWQDQSGNNYHVSQTDNDKRPLLKLAANGINSKPAILFDGSNDLLTRTVADWLSTASAGAVFAVIKLSASPSNNQAVISTADWGSAGTYVVCYAYRAAATPFLVVSQRNNGDTNDNLYGSTSLSAGSTYIMEWRSSGTAYTLRVNAADQTPVISSGADNGDWIADTTTPGRDGFAIGALKYSVEIQPLKGLLAELLVYTSDVTGANLTALETYLNAKYGAWA